MVKGQLNLPNTADPLQTRLNMEIKEADWTLQERTLWKRRK